MLSILHSQFFLYIHTALIDHCQGMVLGLKLVCSNYFVHKLNIFQFPCVIFYLLAEFKFHSVFEL